MSPVSPKDYLSSLHVSADCLGTPIVYSPVKADLTGNIKVGRGTGGLGRGSFSAEMLWVWRGKSQRCLRGLSMGAFWLSGGTSRRVY